MVGAIGIVRVTGCRVDARSGLRNGSRGPSRYPCALAQAKLTRLPQSGASGAGRRSVLAQMRCGEVPDPDAAPVRRDDGRQCRRYLASDAVVAFINTG